MFIMNMFKNHLAVVLIFFILMALVLTFPLVFKVNQYIPGFYSTDEAFTSLWNLWWMKSSFLRHLPYSEVNVISCPFTSKINPMYVYWTLLNRILVLSSNPVLAYNIQVLLSFVLAGVFAYLLALYAIQDRICAFFPAIIFAFCPYHFVRAWQHLGLAHIQWMPLYVLSALALRQRPAVKNTILLAISFSLVMAFDLYYAYFMAIFTAVFILYDGFYSKNAKNTLRLLKLFLTASVFIVLIESIDIYNIVSYASKSHMAQGAYGYIRPFEDLFSQSARPLSYFLPAPTHPIFGKFTEQFVGSALYGESFTEHTLYLGWTPLVLAFIAFRRWKRNKALPITNHHSPVTDKERFYIGFFVLLAIVAWLFSQPPWWKIGAIKFYMPSFFVYKILPMFRAYCRFGIVVMLAVAVLAGFGLKFVLEGFKSQKTKFIITTLFCGLVLFEFWNYPPFKVIDVSRVPAVYYWLGEQSPDITIAEYPLDTNGPNELYKFYQTKHERKIINGTIPGTSAHKLALNITRLSEPDTTGILKWMGVKYALVHQDGYLQTDLTEEREELNKIPKNSGLVFIKSFPAGECPQRDIMCVQKTGPIDVYEVMAQPIEPKIEAK